MHQRTVFALELVKQLKTIRDLEDRVFLNKTTPTQNPNLPTIEIFYQAEDHEEHGKAPVEWMRSFNLEIEIKADGVTDLAMTEHMDDICDQVEQIMIREDEAACALGGVDKIQWTGYTFEFSGNGDRPMGSARFSVTLEYNTERKEVPKLDDLKKVNAEWNINKENDDDPPDVADRPLTEAEDCIDKLDE